MKQKFDFSPGSTLYLPCNLISKDPHLWVILTPPFSSPKKVVMVMLTAKRSYSDKTVILNIEDHPFITHPTVVSYMDADYFKVEELEKDIISGIAELREPFKKHILKKIKKGLLESKQTPKGIKNYCLSVFDFK